MTTIEFCSKRSKPKGFQELSNFYGGVEFEYMAARFTQSEITRLFDTLETCDNETFWNWLQILNPKRNPTQRQMDFWFTKGGKASGKPIRGIAAQLLGTMVRPSAVKRRNAVKNRLGLDSIVIAEELSDDDKRAWMKVCLSHKYSIPYYRDLLLKTGDAVLHEVPMKGYGGKFVTKNGEQKRVENNWTYKIQYGPDKTTILEEWGKDWLGKLLMEIRQELQEEQAMMAAPAFKKRRTMYKQYVQESI